MGLNGERGIKLVLLLRLPDGRLHHRLELPEIRELNLAAVERELVFEHDIHSGAAREFSFGSTR